MSVHESRLDAMRLATWNVNSIRARVTRTVEFCVREHIDVLAMPATGPWHHAHRRCGAAIS